VVSIRACHARDPGSIPGWEVFSAFALFLIGLAAVVIVDLARAKTGAPSWMWQINKRLGSRHALMVCMSSIPDMARRLGSMCQGVLGKRIAKILREVKGI
jgi:hypothetical protein